MNDPTDSAGQRSEALAWLASAAQERETDSLIAPYVDAAAVLSTFSLGSLNPVGPHGGTDRNEALMELTNRCTFVGSPRRDIWQLKESFRRMALRRLGSRRAMCVAREANPAAAADPLQQGFDLLIGTESALGLAALTLDQLLGVERAARWLEGIVAALPSSDELAPLIERERQLAPMRKLAGTGFVDRENYLAQLADYVGALPPGTVWRGLRRGLKYVAYWMDKRPPLHLCGPGGIGKSALLARFILEHTNPSEHPQPLPFVYLDFDRAVLDPRKPETILEEAIRQLLIQFPSVDADLAGLGAQARESASRFDGVESSKSRHFASSEHLIGRFCRLLEVIATTNDQPVLIVLDTLEEAEYQGASSLRVTWSLLADLLERVDRLRIVTAGRSPLPPRLPREAVELPGLPPRAAEDVIIRHVEERGGGEVSSADARAIVAIVGTVPLSLKLAARVVVNEGVAGLRDTVKRQQLFSRIKAEQQQGMLYRRILGHVRAHDPVLERVANPGLILRRITPALIEQVLAGPCRLDPSDQEHTPELLFEALSLEVGLVDPYREPGALWHIPAVRRIMLPDLIRTLGELPQLIHAAAANYYQGRSEAIERAEGIYHRLWLGDGGPELDGLWTPDLQAHLRGAFEEMPAHARIWLGDKLGIELDDELRALADREVWERQAEQRARTLLSSGLVADALAALRERERALRPSPLYALEADALKLLGRTDEALAVLQAGLAVAEQAADRGAKLPLVMRMAFLHEANQEFVEAWRNAMAGTELAQELQDWLELLSGGAALLRLARKAEGSQWSRESARERGWIVELKAFEAFLATARKAMLEIVGDELTRSALKSRPALLCEVTAELGSEDLGLLAEAISLLGITPDDLIALGRYAQHAESSALTKAQMSLLTEVQLSGTSRGLGHRIAELVPAFPEFFVLRLRQSVEDSLRRTLEGPERAKAEKPPTLTGAQMKSLLPLVSKNFTPNELELLTLDSFDVQWSNIVNPTAPYDQQVFQLLQYANSLGSLPRFAASLQRSRPDDTDLQNLLGGFV